MPRLTDEQQWDRKVTEAEHQKLVTDLATIYGWLWVHFRHARTAGKVWVVPVEGPLGKGWPDLVLVHPHKHRVLFVELKRELAHAGVEQEWVGLMLVDGGAEYQIWRPSDLRGERIQDMLK